MSEVTRLLSAMEHGDPRAAEQLLPLVYDELRRLAAQRLAQEAPGQTLQPTALVHEAYLRLVKPAPGASSPGATSGATSKRRDDSWDNRGHFFAAAAEAMRRILVEKARSKGAAKRGGQGKRLELERLVLTASTPSPELLALDEALTELESHDAPAAQLVKLRYFAGLTHQQAAKALGITRRSADRLWSLARAWLFQQLEDK